MRKVLTGLCFILFQFFFSEVHAQWVQIPNIELGNWLRGHGYNSCLIGDSIVGWQMDTTCSLVTMADSLDFTNQFMNGSLEGIQYFDNLEYLIAGGNAFYYYPPLPRRLKELNAAHNQISSMPAFPDSINFLNFFNCSALVNLPALPPQLNTLGIELCSSLTVIPPLPNGLYCLYTTYTHLALPALPSSLRQLICRNCGLVSLPPLPSYMEIIDCRYNLLTSLPELPDSIRWWLDCSNNPNLTCLPTLKKMFSFSYYNTGITCLPNYPLGSPSCNPPINTVGLCDLFNNSNNCPYEKGIYGKVYLDSNLNCQLNTSETRFNNLKLKLYDASNNLIQQTLSYSNGNYFFHQGTLGAFFTRLDTTNLPFRIRCPSSGFYTSVFTSLDSVDLNSDFALECKDFDIAAQSITGSLLPGQITRLAISAGDLAQFYGASCVHNLSGTVQLILDGQIHYISAVQGGLLPDSIAGDTLTWVISDFSNVNFFTAFNIFVQADSLSQSGDVACFTLHVSPTNGDVDSTNNTLVACLTIAASHDPNEKSVYPVGNINSQQNWLTYTVNFQNTGTAAAQNIYIIDSLNTSLEPGTLQLLAYSHQPIVRLKDNVVEIKFLNINLPDSNSNEPSSHGYVQYKVKLRNGLLTGTKISNTASIYFDLNQPVITNTATNCIPSVGTDIISACESYRWIDGNTYTANNNTATFTFVGGGTNGCDSVVTLNLTINNSKTGTDSVIACESYSWIDGKTYTANNDTATFTFVGGGANGCDSIVILNLKVNALPFPVLMRQNDTLYTQIFSTYEWQLNGNTVSGNSNTLLITEGGNYEVFVTDSNGCTNVSSPLNVFYMSIDNSVAKDSEKLYPNPNEGVFTIMFSDNELHKIYITNMLGRILLDEVKVQQRHEFNIANQPAGIYFVQVVKGERIKTYKLTKL